MKKYLALFLLVITVPLTISACSNQETCEQWRNAGYNTGYEEGWADGFSDGYDTGLIWGAFESQDDIASQVRDLYAEKEFETAKKCGWHPEEAIIILNDYMNGENVSTEDLRSAIESISYFYYEAWEVVSNIDEIDVDFDFD